MIYYTQPYQHQRDAVEQAFGRPEFAFFMEQGVGKSKIIIDEAVNLIEISKVNLILILSPNGLQTNWEEQFRFHAPGAKVTIQIYKSGTPPERQEKRTREILASDRVLVFLANIETLQTVYGSSYLYRLLRAKRNSYLVIDESHKIKSPKAIRTKRAIELSKLAKYRRIATGTEAEEGIHELYSQFAFLNPRIIGSKTYTAFKGMYCVMGGFQNSQILRYQNQEILADRIRPYVFSVRKKDCLDLPDQVYVPHFIEMTKQQRTLYDTIEEQLILELDNGTILDATLAITRMMRLQQVLCGHLENQQIESFRASYIGELIEAEPGKSLVFCRFRNDVDIMLEQLKKRDIPAVGFKGGDADRDEIISSWRNGARALVMTVATGGTGLTLNEAHNTIFYSNDWSATTRYQAEARNHRIGQNDKVTYHDVMVRSKVDHRLLKALRNKQRLSEAFRNLVEIKKFLTENDYESSAERA